MVLHIFLTVFNLISITAYVIRTISSTLGIMHPELRELVHVQSHTSGLEPRTAPYCLPVITASWTDHPLSFSQSSHGPGPPFSWEKSRQRFPTLGTPIGGNPLRCIRKRTTKWIMNGTVISTCLSITKAYGYVNQGFPSAYYTHYFLSVRVHLLQFYQDVCELHISCIT